MPMKAAEVYIVGHMHRGHLVFLWIPTAHTGRPKSGEADDLLPCGTRSAPISVILEAHEIASLVPGPLTLPVRPGSTRCGCGSGSQWCGVLPIEWKIKASITLPIRMTIIVK